MVLQNLGSLKSFFTTDVLFLGNGGECLSREKQYKQVMKYEVVRHLVIGFSITKLTICNVSKLMRHILIGYVWAISHTNLVEASLEHYDLTEQLSFAFSLFDATVALIYLNEGKQVII